MEAEARRDVRARSSASVFVLFYQSSKLTEYLGFVETEARRDVRALLLVKGC